MCVYDANGCGELGAKAHPEHPVRCQKRKGGGEKDKMGHFSCKSCVDTLREGEGLGVPSQAMSHPSKFACGERGGISSSEITVCVVLLSTSLLTPRRRDDVLLLFQMSLGIFPNISQFHHDSFFIFSPHSQLQSRAHTKSSSFRPSFPTPSSLRSQMKIVVYSRTRMLETKNPHARSLSSFKLFSIDRSFRPCAGKKVH